MILFAADFDHRFLGARSVTLRKAVTQGNPSVLALSSRTWLNYLWQGQLNFDPLIFDSLDQACGLSAGEVCPEGIIGVSGETLRLAFFPFRTLLLLLFLDVLR